MESLLTQPGWRGEMDEMEMPAGLDGRLFTLQQALDRSDAVPTRQAREVARDLFKRTEDVLAEMERLIRERLAAVNTSIGSEGLAPITEA